MMSDGTNGMALIVIRRCADSYTDILDQPGAGFMSADVQPSFSVLVCWRCVLAKFSAIGRLAMGS